MKNLISRKSRGKKGEGRTVKFTPINIPVELADDLKLYRDIYSDVVGDKVSLESMLRSWMEIMAEQEPEVQRAFEDAKKSREEFTCRMAAGLGLTPEQLEANRAAFNPTDPVNEPWNLRYVFEKDGDEVEAIPGDKAPFYAKIGGRNVGMKEMLANDWVLMNDAGIELDIDQAWQINHLIKEHVADAKDNANESLWTMLTQNAERRRNSNEPEITMDEINAEIAAYRAEKK